MSLLKRDDWDDALEEAGRGAIARGEKQPVVPFVPPEGYDWGQTITIPLDVEIRRRLDMRKT